LFGVYYQTIRCAVSDWILCVDCVFPAKLRTSRGGLGSAPRQRNAYDPQIEQVRKVAQVLDTNLPERPALTQCGEFPPKKRKTVCSKMKNSVLNKQTKIR